MLKREFRLRKDDEIKKVLKKGISQYDEICGFRFLKSDRDYSRATVIVSKKVHKRAVKRNALKRQYRDIIRRILPEFKEKVDIAFFPSNKAIEVSFEEKENRLKEKLQKKGLL